MQRLVIEYLQRSASLYPGRTAIVDGTRTITYHRLWVDALVLGNWIAEVVPRPRRPILVAIPKSIEAVTAILAVQLAGHIYVPIDPAAPPLRRQSMVETLDGPPALEFVEGRFSLAGQSLTPGEQDPGEWATLEHISRQRLASLISLDPLYVIFTSGTTGEPKGVTISNGAVIDYVEWVVETYDLTCDEVIGSQAPLFFDNSVLDLYGALATGASLHLIPREKFVFLSDLVSYLERQRISLIFFVPSLLATLAGLDLLRGRSLPHLRKVLFAGEVMPLSALRYLRRHLPHALLSNLYGPTEITVDAIYWICGEELDGIEAVPLGTPCSNKRILFLDDEGRVVEDDDVVAEICVAGVGVSLGYWNDPGRTAERFIQTPEHHRYREVIYRTGDYGYRSSKDGLIYFAGRRDQQIKHQGYRIELGEIESALERLEEVRQCCVVYDGAAREIVAFCVSVAELDPGSVRGRLAQSLAPYMMPHRILCLERLPVTVNGKVDRAALAERVTHRERGQGRLEADPSPRRGAPDHD